MSVNLCSAGRAPGRSQAGPHPLGGSTDVLVGRGAPMSRRAAPKANTAARGAEVTQ